MAPRMEATVHADKSNRVVLVVVEHADYQSFTRSVVPKAKRVMKQWVSENIVFGLPYLSDGSLAWHTTPDGRCLSHFVFTY